MKTIFISSFHGYTGRNVLATDAFRQVVQGTDVRLVIFTLPSRVQYFRSTFSQENVIIEGVAFAAPSTVRRATLFFKRLAKYGLDTASTKIERRLKWRAEGRFSYFVFLSAVAFVFCRLGPASALMRRFMRRLDFWLRPRGRWEPYFATYQPVLIWATDVQNERDVELMQHARAFGVSVLGMVRSWDNLTLHGLLRVKPNMLVVPGAQVRRQAVSLHDMPAKQVVITGPPHYDRYTQRPSQSKEKFFGACGLDPGKKTIFFAVISDYYTNPNDIDPDALKLLADLSHQVIVRFSPSLTVKALDGADAPEHMVFDRPGRVLAGKERELTLDDDERLRLELLYSDVVLCGPSTIALDAAFLNRPVVLLSFHRLPRPYYLHIRRRYDYDHFQFARDAGAVRIASNPEELRALIAQYLADPALDGEGRKRLVENYVAARDGRAGQRVARAVRAML